MPGLISPDRWTCPECGGTEAPDVPEGAMQGALHRAQRKHARDHADELTETMKAGAR